MEWLNYKQKIYVFDWIHEIDSITICEKSEERNLLNVLRKVIRFTTAVAISSLIFAF